MIKSRPAPAMEFNDRWYVVIPGRRFVQEAVILSMTEETVLLQVEPDESAFTQFGIELSIPSPVRYVKTDVRWIELVG